MSSTVLAPDRTPNDRTPTGRTSTDRTPTDRTDSRGSTIPAWGLATVLFAVYAVFSTQRHRQLLTTGFDLGIFEQYVRSMAAGGAPYSSLLGGPLLAEHFSPLLAVLVPLYRLWPGAETLLVAQAAFLAVAVVPLVRWAWRRSGPFAALVVGLGYGLSWGVWSAVVFDFHEVVLAVPFLAWSLAAFGRRRYLPSVLLAAPILLVKEDLGLTFAVLGGLVAWRGARRLGLITALIGVTTTAVLMTVVLPAMGSGTNRFLAGQTPQVHSLDDLTHVVVASLTNPVQMTTALLLVAITGFGALRSPLVLLVLPTLAWRFASTNPAYWGTRYHYSVVLMPIVFAALVDALPIRTRSASGGGRLPTTLVASLLCTLLLVPMGPLLSMFAPTFWSVSPQTTAITTLLSRIPDGARVASTNNLAPQLTARTDVVLIGRADLTAVEPTWIVADTADPNWHDPIAHELAAAQLRGYRVVATSGSVELLEAGPTSVQVSGG